MHTMDKEDLFGPLDLVAGEVLTYWFGMSLWKGKLAEASGEAYDELWKNKWFAKEEMTEKVDQEINTRFGKHVGIALKGGYDEWTETAFGSLALIILVDQFTRNIFRHTSDAYSGDPKARRICITGIRKGFDKELPLICRTQFYLPLVHSEKFEDQEQSLQLYKKLEKKCNPNQFYMFERWCMLAKKHYDVISTFGRYPERNKYMLRKSTEEEGIYLSSSFLQTKYLMKL